MNNRTYNVLKSVAQIWIPALASLYFALASIWGWPNTTEVIGSLSGIDTFLGAVLAISTSSYNAKQTSDGQLVVDKSDPVKDSYTLQLSTPIDELSTKDKLVLDVKPA